MSQLNSIEYYRRREREERDLGQKAKNPMIAAIHNEMADRYSRLTKQAGSQPHLRMASPV